jgi:MFS family permease
MSLSPAAGSRYDFFTMARDSSSFSMAEGDSKGPNGNPWRKRPSTILWVLSLGQLITWGLVYYTFPLFVGPMEQELGWSRDQLYGALSAGLLVAGLCSIPVGAWIDRGHARMLMTGGSILAALLLFVWSQVHTLPMLYAVWLGLGACQSVTLYEPAFAVITRVFGPRYKQAILLMTFLGALASTFGIPFAQFLIERIGWRPALEVMAVVILGVGFVIHWPFVPGPSEAPVPIGDAPKAHVADGKRRKSPLAAAIRVPAFWGLVVAFAGYGLAFSAMSFHLIPILVERGVQMGVVMAIVALVGPMQLVGRVLLLAGQRHVTTIQLGAGIYFAFPICMAMLALGISDVYGLILFAILYGIANGLLTILRGMAVPEFIGPEGYGVVSGALTMPTNVMRAAGPLAAAFFWSWSGHYMPVLWGLAAIMLVAAAGFAAAALLSRKPSPYPPV